ncbi:MAG: Gfo/Idh/MocA family oxidoreductase, partial [Opitutales bacterium]|nr:Gfo/Idh/MocA family oxidoreductase [Opitutales bacterium]
MESVNIGIIGVGNMGAAHARAIQEGKVPGLKLTGLQDVNPDRAKGFEGVTAFDSPQALIESNAVDAVLIATPHYDHTPLGIAALKAGKHVLVEKPISVHKADCEALIDAHTDKSLVFCAMFNQRTNPHYIRIRDLIQKGELGEIRRVVWTITDWFRSEAYYASGGWRATWRGEGGGVLLNQCPHQLDLWQWLFGMPQKLRAFCELGRYHDIEVEDDVTCYMEYANGCKGVFITTTGESPGSNRLEITGERGRLVYDMEKEGLSFLRNEVETSEWSRTTTGGFTKPPTWDVSIPIDGGNGPQHLGIMRNFADAILKGTPVLAPAEEGIHSVELGNAMLYSSFTDATLELPLD